MNNYLNYHGHDTSRHLRAASSGHVLRSLLLAGMIVLLLLISGAPVSAYSGVSDPSADRYIIMFDEGVGGAAALRTLGRYNVVVGERLPIINGAVVYLPRSVVSELRDEPLVRHLEKDSVVFALSDPVGIAAPGGNGKPAPAQPAEVLPWGVDRIDAELAWTVNRGTSVKVGVIDTGISLSHPDLAGNISGGYNAIDPAKSANDDNGHGSHVAGTIGAIDNTIGVIGVAPEVDLYAIKVLNRNGSGSLSDVIEGIDWARTNGMDVVNMSLGSASDSLSMHVAVAQAQNAGVIVVASAGNSGGSVGFPAAYMEAIAVSATDQNDVITSFSSRGPEVDVAAPGVSVYSSYKGSSYATLSGTSMSAPHATGSLALLLLTAPGAYDVNFNGSWDPEEAQRKLEDTALDLGAAGKDALYGSGRIDALSLVTS